MLCHLLRQQKPEKKIFGYPIFLKAFFKILSDDAEVTGYTGRNLRKERIQRSSDYMYFKLMEIHGLQGKESVEGEKARGAMAKP